MPEQSRRRFFGNAAVVAATAVTPAVIGRLWGQGRRADARLAYQLNETGWFVYQQYRNGRDLESITAEVAERYEVSIARAERDVRQYVAQLRRAGLVT